MYPALALWRRLFFLMWHLPDLPPSPAGVLWWSLWHYTEVVLFIRLILYDCSRFSSVWTYYYYINSVVVCMILMCKLSKTTCLWFWLYLYLWKEKECNAWRVRDGWGGKFLKQYNNRTDWLIYIMILCKVGLSLNSMLNHCSRAICDTAFNVHFDMTCFI